ncbi:hypothetical protein BASA60_006612, partial [Batrachochytrium salamandrivorans]
MWYSSFANTRTDYICGNTTRRPKLPVHGPGVSHPLNNTDNDENLRTFDGKIAGKKPLCSILCRKISNEYKWTTKVTVGAGVDDREIAASGV